VISHVTSPFGVPAPGASTAMTAVKVTALLLGSGLCEDFSVIDVEALVIGSPNDAEEFENAAEPE
jgi:hypothetical protein